MSIFLRLKAWQVFLFAGAPAAISFVIGFEAGFGLTLPRHQYVALFVDTWEAIGSLLTLAYVYTLGTKLNLGLDTEKRESLTLFKLSFIASLIVLIALAWYAFDDTTTFSDIKYLLAIGGAIHMYTYYVVAKLLETVERKWGEIGDNFFALLFMPIGIWFMQPRINKVFRDQ